MKNPFKEWDARVGVRTMSSDGLRAGLRALILKNDPKQEHLIRAVKAELDRRNEQYEGK